MTKLDKARWYLNRLRLMQPAEVWHRLLGGAQAATQRAAVAVLPQRLPEPSMARFGKPWCERWPDDASDTEACVAAADRLLQGRWQVFSLREAELGFPPEWNHDPLSGTRAPMSFGKTLDYRDDKRVGNIKYLWEPSRHLELVTLAQAWRGGRDPRHLRACGVLLQSWFDQCPYPWGVHWASSLELAVRLLNWSVAWHLLGGAHGALFEGEPGQTLRRRWLDQVHLHQRFIAGHLSRHSSANNHLLGELMGLFIAALTWPCWPQSERWRELGRRGFEQQALLQNHDDGVNKEQGIYYHHEVVDMMLLCGLYGRANGHDFSPVYWQRLEAMLGFIDAMMDVSGQIPMFGDADDALMVRFDPRPDFDPFRSLLCTGAELFGRPAWRRGAGCDAKTRWLLGECAPSPLPPRAGTAARAFAQGGYWQLGSGRGTPQEVHLVADAGPLGYLSIAAHGHADALAFVLSLGGQPILVDAGTFAYHTHKRWRDYFRGTAAHNTLCVDAQDQSVIGGNFMWLHKAEARCLEFGDDGQVLRWVAEHDGYRRLADPLTHRRRIEHWPREHCIRVTDDVLCAGQHRLQWHWHFAPECRIERTQAGARIQAPGWQLQLQVVGPALQFSVHVGEEDPPLGWLSRRFDHKEPSPTLRVAGACDGNLTIVTELRYKPHTNGQQATS